MPSVGELGSEEPQVISRKGRLELEFARDATGRTHIGRQYFSYPFHICRPFHLDIGSCEGMATVYTQSCSGGLYGLDRLTLDVRLRRGAQAHLTTQASTIVHRATHGITEQVCTISAEDEALVEHLPDATILFPGSHLKSSVRLVLADTANAFLSDSFLLHDYGDGSNVFELFDNTITITSPTGAPIAVDRYRVTGEEFLSGRTGIMGPFICHGSVLAVTPRADVDALIGGMRRAAAAFGDCAMGFSRLPKAKGFSARILAHDAIQMRRAMLEVWAQFRIAVADSVPRPRRK